MSHEHPGRLVEYHAISYSLDGDGHMTGLHLRLDLTTRRLVSELLQCWTMEDGAPLFPTEAMELVLREWSNQARRYEGTAVPVRDPASVAHAVEIQEVLDLRF